MDLASYETNIMYRNIRIEKGPIANSTTQTRRRSTTRESDGISTSDPCLAALHAESAAPSRPSRRVRISIGVSVPDPTKRVERPLRVFSKRLTDEITEKRRNERERKTRDKS